MNNLGGQSYTINGIKVLFPHKAYPSQLSMMDKIIKGLERKQNCLLESPTGSGKSLALLCSALAWQRHEAEKSRLEEKEFSEKDSCCTCRNVEKSDSGEDPSYLTATNQMVPAALSVNQTPLVGCVSNSEAVKNNEDDDFKPDRKTFRTPAGVSQPRSSTSPVADIEDLAAPQWRMEVNSTEASCCSCTCGASEMKPKKREYDHTIQGSGGSMTRQYGDEHSKTKRRTSLGLNHKHQSKNIIYQPGFYGLFYQMLKRDQAVPVQLVCLQLTFRIPKIWFGTRTHKQVAQITRELGKTAYKGVKMTILSSREHSCIHPEVSTMSSKNEECKNLMDGPGCRWFDNVRRKVSFASLRLGGVTEAWDLEDFKGFCKKAKACAYFGARQLKMDAEIVFCPYNYLIDPNIRESLEILLKDQIVILDEAHNIEDSSREAASHSMVQNDVTDTIDDLNKMIGFSIKVKEHRAIRDMMTGFHNLVENHRETTTSDNFDTAYKMWSGMEMVAQLKFCGITTENFNELKTCFGEIAKDETEEVDKNRRGPDPPKLKANTLKVVGSLFTVLDFVIRGNLKHMEDYRMALVKTMTYVTQNNDAGGWLNKKKRARKKMDWSFSLNFWCLNPAVAFTDLGMECRSVVLTSGTLSPMSSFQSELDVPFPIQLEASHVIGKSQVWVGTISKGPRGNSLLGNYQNSETFAYQDDVGEVLLEVCKTVPHGVLCFVSSYKTVEKFFDRWKNTGLYDRLSEHKVVMSEPKASDRVDFDQLIKQYYETIEEYEDADEGVTGALFVAVCRGKVSEGLDFADNNARAVITVGIPFPYIKDPQVDLKKQYNNQHSMKKGLLKGGEWYEIQAYRALNQALGRCIRHRNDWGALILVDERFSKHQRYTKGLSKWVRQKVQHFYAFNAAKQSLLRFTQDRLANPTTNDVSVMNLTAAHSIQSPGPSTPNVMKPARTPPEFKTPYSASTPAITKTSAPNKWNEENELIHQTASPALTPKPVPLFKLNVQPCVDINKGFKIESTGKYNEVPNTIFPSHIDPHKSSIDNSACNRNTNTFIENKASSHIQNADTQVLQTQGDIVSKTIVSGDVEMVEDSMEGFIDIREDFDDLDFKPTFASTQMTASQKPKSYQRRLSKDLSKNVKGQLTMSTNTNMKEVTESTNKDVLESKTKQSKMTLKEKLMKHNFDLKEENVTSKKLKQENKANPYEREEIERAGHSHLKQMNSENKNFLFQFVNIPDTSNTMMQQNITVSNSKDNLVTGTRSSSPELFDSDNEVMSCDNELDEVIKDMCTDVNVMKAIEKRNVDSGGCGDNANVAVVKPLFKQMAKHNGIQAGAKESAMSVTNISTNLHSKENVDIKISDKSKLRIRRSLSRDIKEETEGTGKDYVYSDNINEECPVKVKSEDGKECKIEDEQLVTRRESRTKRRRLITGKVPVNKKIKSRGVNFINDVEAEKLYTLKCKSCYKVVLDNFKGYTSDIDLPHYVQMLAKDRQVQVINPDHITEKVEKGFSLQTTMQDGGELNSYWSDADGCCYKYIICSCNRTTLGLELKCVDTAHHASVKPGQIWIFHNSTEILPVENKS